MATSLMSQKVCPTTTCSNWCSSVNQKLASRSCSSDTRRTLLRGRRTLPLEWSSQLTTWEWKMLWCERRFGTRQVKSAIEPSQIPTTDRLLECCWSTISLAGSLLNQSASGCKKCATMLMRKSPLFSLETRVIWRSSDRLAMKKQLASHRIKVSEIWWQIALPVSIFKSLLL